MGEFRTGERNAQGCWIVQAKVSPFFVLGTESVAPALGWRMETESRMKKREISPFRGVYSPEQLFFIFLTIQP